MSRTPCAGFVHDPARDRPPRRPAGPERAAERLASVRKDLPIYVVSGERDPVGANIEGLIAALKGAGFTRLTTKIYPGARHETLQRDEPGRGDARPHRLAG